MTTFMVNWKVVEGEWDNSRIRTFAKKSEAVTYIKSQSKAAALNGKETVWYVSNDKGGIVASGTFKKGPSGAPIARKL